MSIYSNEVLLKKAGVLTRREHELKSLAIEEASKEETTRLNAEIPISLHNKIKIRAVEEGKGSSRLHLLEEAIAFPHP